MFATLRRLGSSGRCAPVGVGEIHIRSINATQRETRLFNMIRKRKRIGSKWLTAGSVFTFCLAVATVATVSFVPSAVAAPKATIAASFPEVSPADCIGKRPEHILRYFSTPIPYRSVPFRCGGGYGMRHIADRWHPGFEEQMTETLAAPKAIVPQGGTTLQFVSVELPPCGAGLFTVVVNYRNFNDGQPIGVITAFDGGKLPPKVCARR